MTNIQQFYERPDRDDDEPDAMTAMLGPKPPRKKMEGADFAERIARRAGHLLLINDEAHHTHDEGSEWNAVIGKLHEKTPMVAQLDFSATPRFRKTGSIFPWTISRLSAEAGDCGGVVKRPVKGVAKIPEPSRSTQACVSGYLTAGGREMEGVSRAAKALRRKPVLFVMMNSTEEADDVATGWRRLIRGSSGVARRKRSIPRSRARSVTRNWKRPERR